jgi:hypothetical protein
MVLENVSTAGLESSAAAPRSRGRRLRTLRTLSEKRARYQSMAVKARAYPPSPPFGATSVTPGRRKTTRRTCDEKAHPRGWRQRTKVKAVRRRAIEPYRVRGAARIGAGAVIRRGVGRIPRTGRIRTCCLLASERRDRKVGYGAGACAGLAVEARDYQRAASLLEVLRGHAAGLATVGVWIRSPKGEGA